MRSVNRVKACVLVSVRVCACITMLSLWQSGKESASAMPDGGGNDDGGGGDDDDDDSSRIKNPPQVVRINRISVHFPSTEGLCYTLLGNVNMQATRFHFFLPAANKKKHCSHNQ